MSDQLAPQGKYLYCIVRGDPPAQMHTRGIGERGDVVHTLHAGDLAAVVSDSPLIEYDQSRRTMLAHTLVLEEVMQTHTILPIRFGVVAPSAEAIEQQLLLRRAPELHSLLDELDGHTELGIKAFWYEGAIFEEILAERPPIRELRDSLIGVSPAQTYYQRIELGEQIEQAMQQHRARDAAQIMDKLSPLAVRVHTGTILTDRMVINAAFLVNTAHKAAFDQAVDELDTELGGRLIFKYVSNAPPYNFVHLTLAWDAPDAA